MRYDRNYIGENLRSPWLDEGVADYVAAMREEDFLERRRRWIAEKAARGLPPPAFAELRRYKTFYDQGDVDLHYWLSALLTRRLIGRDGAARIPLILDNFVKSADAEVAVRIVMGKDPEAEYGKLIAEFWKR